MAGAAKRWNKLQGMLQQAGHEKTLKKLGQALNEYLVGRFQNYFSGEHLCFCVCLCVCLCMHVDMVLLHIGI